MDDKTPLQELLDWCRFVQRPRELSNAQMIVLLAQAAAIYAEDMDINEVRQVVVPE